MANTLGRLFTVTSFGESHGDCVGVVIDNCPAGLPITVAEIQEQADRRKPGSMVFASPRREDDRVEVFSGIFNGLTTGAPICLVIWNRNIDSSDYERIHGLLRPGHADYTAFIKYGGYNDYRGSGRFSGRITASFVMAGAIAKKLLSTIGVETIAHTIEIGGIRTKETPYDKIREQMRANDVNCADPEAAAEMVKAIIQTAKAGDSLGGIVEALALNVPSGLGEPVFDTLEGALARAYFAIPAVKGVEFGAGFEVARMKGSEDNDPYLLNSGKLQTTTNNAGGILGGISSGMPLKARIAVKPTPSISKPQDTVDIKSMRQTQLSIHGRHDTCIVPRAVPVIEAMTAITLVDFALEAQILPRVIK